MNPFKISPNYTAVRFGLNGLFDEIESLDADISPLVDIGETIRIMLADFFYSDYVKPLYNNVRINDRVIVFKQGTIKADVTKYDHAEATLGLLANKFWDLSDYIYNNVLRATQDYSHLPSDCFYQYSAQDKAINVYLPQLENIPVITAPLPAAAVIHACLQTLPSLLRHLINDMTPVMSEKDEIIKNAQGNVAGALKVGKY